MLEVVPDRLPERAQVVARPAPERVVAFGGGRVEVEAARLAQPARVAEDLRLGQAGIAGAARQAQRLGAHRAVDLDEVPALVAEERLPVAGDPGARAGRCRCGARGCGTACRRRPARSPRGTGPRARARRADRACGGRCASNAGSLKRARLLLADRRAVHVLERALAVGLGRGAAEEPHLQRAGARRLHVLGPLRGLEDHADADRRQALLPVLVELAVDLLGLARHRQHQRRAVGLLAPAVAVAVDVAVDVEQRLGARRVVAAVVAAQRRVEAVGARRHRRLRRRSPGRAG